MHGMQRRGGGEGGGGLAALLVPPSINNNNYNLRITVINSNNGRNACQPGLGACGASIEDEIA